MRRQSFIVQVHPGGISVVENLRTRERVGVEELNAVGALIERWVDEAVDEAGGSDEDDQEGVGNRHPGVVGRGETRP
jgi:uncharacterized protein (DUF2342 family)